ncbi:MAG: putative ArsR family transcriptional regulator [Candidatus Azotimanducaceae bacterium]|jgi:predicted ArsR family transcriptional regulator
MKDQNSPESSQDKILYQLKRSGPLSAKEIGQRMSITTMGTRQHLAQLEAANLVKTLPEEAQGRGRPLKRWALTGAGHERFPDSHAQVTLDLLISVTDVLGEAALDKLIDHRTERTLLQYSVELEQQDGLENKLASLAELRSKEGYMAEIQLLDSDYLLVEHHCPICIAATSCQGFCRSELDVFQQLLKGVATVERSEHILAGARRCTYRICEIVQ